MANALNLDNGTQLFNICLETNGDSSFKAHNIAQLEVTVQKMNADS